MAPHDLEHDQAQDAESSSSESQSESETPESSPKKPPRNLFRRESSIQFSEGTKTQSQSPMSNFHRTTGDSDEITPIRSADNYTGRRYNTGENSSPSSSRSDAAHEEEGGREREDGGKKQPRSPWFKKMVEKYGAVSLENKGSVARDHLALERTFLAWLRTSLAFASIGIAITQLFRLNTTIASQSEVSMSRISLAGDQIPFSPLIGQSVPAELVPYLQQLLASSTPPPIPTFGPTLLDQLLLLPPPNSKSLQLSKWDDLSAMAFDEHAAARLRHVGKPLGATFLGISIIILFIGFHRYFEAQHWIMRGKFPASRGSIFITGFIAGSLIIASLAVVLAISPTSYEKKK
ncbi:uncharacterized protein Z518_06300 [Rhinocladiella mackenziei CBS 650.93]|uniref:Rhinocladiella mackenziei CBS 650.93 unplaced genomic scaffold supercont1.4, whole genome shotgun sequence n=1 Tax=Rhinocladiella mackenziei CBS 650.93 TaxID=1442369 RepID=A0A0D2H4U8_9EURO|nr:uncharacterized protein Z518_06300 [Rhinocladiella mackenziei CBS 650.93]KIX05428.1 hypothetical protein Z518_06300 [Rhinocladiella mackenziei CBS 650.93]